MRRSRRRRKNSGIVIAIIAVIILIIVIIVMALVAGSHEPMTSAVTFYGPRKTASDTEVARLNGVELHWYGKSSDAIKNAAAVVLQGENSLEFDCSGVTISVEGKSSGNRASTGNSQSFLDTAKNAVNNLLSSGSGIINQNGSYNFTINADKFQKGEVVIVTAEFSDGVSELDKSFGRGVGTGYFAFTAGEGGPAVTVETVTGETPVSTESSSEVTDVSSISDDVSSFFSDENLSEMFSGFTSETNIESSEAVIVTETETAEAESETAQEQETGETKFDEAKVLDALRASTSVFFNGFELPSYESKEDALAHAMKISSEAAANSSFTVTVDEETTARVRMWIENEHGSNLYDEHILYSENGWTDSFSLSKYSGKTIILGISISDKEIISNMAIDYIAVEVP